MGCTPVTQPDWFATLGHKPDFDGLFFAIPLLFHWPIAEKRGNFLGYGLTKPRLTALVNWKFLGRCFNNVS